MTLNIELDLALVDLERMAAEAEEISLGTFKRLLGIAPAAVCNAATIEEAKNAFNAAKEGSEEEAAALLTLETLLMAAIARATTADEAGGIWSDCPSGSDSEVRLMERWIELCTTTEDALDAYCTALGASSTPVAIQKLAARKLATFFVRPAVS